MFFSSNISYSDIKNDVYGFNKRIEIKQKIINRIITNFNNFLTDDFINNITNDYIIKQIENIQNYNKMYAYKIKLVDSLDYENTYIKHYFMIFDDFKYDYIKFIKTIQYIIKKTKINDKIVNDLLNFLDKQYKFEIMLL